MRRIKIEEHTRLSDELENWLMSYKTMNVTTVTLKNYRHIISDLIKLIGDIPVLLPLIIGRIPRHRGSRHIKNGLIVYKVQYAQNLLCLCDEIGYGPVRFNRIFD